MSTEVYALSHKTQTIVIGSQEVTAHMYTHLGTTSYVSSDNLERLDAIHMDIGPKYGVILFDDDDPSPVITNIRSGLWKDCNDRYPGDLVGFMVKTSFGLHVVDKSKWSISNGGDYVVAYDEKGNLKRGGVIEFRKPIRYRTRHVNSSGLHVVETTYVDVDDVIHPSMDSIISKYKEMSIISLADQLVEHRDRIVANRISDLESMIALDEELVISTKERIAEAKRELKSLITKGENNG